MGLMDLLGTHRPGFALEQGFYSRADVFARDMTLLTGRWSFAAHVSELPTPGDWVVANLGRESAIVARGEDGTLRAFANVCRHRGSRVCTKSSGHGRLFVCPYHAWAYGLDGSLKQAREMPEGFDPAAHGLLPLPLVEIGGVLFVSYGDAPPALDAARATLAPALEKFGWPGARIAARKTYKVSANWKLAMENYHECYHCGPAHPEFSHLHALAAPGNREIGGEDREAWPPQPDGQEVFRSFHSGLAAGAVTGSRDGKPVAPLMAAAYDGQCLFAELGFVTAFLCYADHGLIYRFLPRDVLDTEMEVIWLVRGDAEAGRDYDPEALTWLWDVTSQADKRIIEMNQAGVLSRAYRPGPFSLMEPGARQYVERYVGELKRAAAEG